MLILKAKLFNFKQIKFTKTTKWEFALQETKMAPTYVPLTLIKPIVPFNKTNSRSYDILYY